MEARNLYKLLTIVLLVAPFAMMPANATMTCDPVATVVCTGDSGSDAYAGCDGNWADVWAQGNAYVQVCLGYDGENHVWVCPMAGTFSDGCEVTGA